MGRSIVPCLEQKESKDLFFKFLKVTIVLGPVLDTNQIK